MLWVVVLLLDLMIMLLLLLLRRLLLGDLMGRRRYHEVEAFLGRRQLGEIVFGVGSTDVLLHGAEPLLLCGAGIVSNVECGLIGGAMGGLGERDQEKGGDLRQGIAFYNWSHLGSAMGRRPRCLHP